MPKTRTPRELLLAALERRRLTGFRASPDAAWVMFDSAADDGTTLEVIHLPRANRFRVVSSKTTGMVASTATTLGNFRSSDAAAACIEDALTSDAGHAGPRQSGALLN